MSSTESLSTNRPEEFSVLIRFQDGDVNESFFELHEEYYTVEEALRELQLEALEEFKTKGTAIPDDDALLKDVDMAIVSDRVDRLQKFLKTQTGITFITTDDDRENPVFMEVDYRNTYTYTAKDRKVFVEGLEYFIDHGFEIVRTERIRHYY